MKKDSTVSRPEEVFAQMARDLSSTANAISAAEIILNAANRLIGWDACYLILYDPAKGGKPRPLLTIDTADDKIIIQPNAAPEHPSENMLRAIRNDGFLSLYDETFPLPDHMAFGNRARRTLSQLFVPVRNEVRVIGVMSIQSYTRHAYTEQSLDTLKTLANYCAGALERIWAQEEVTHLAERLKVLHQAAHDISASLDMDELCGAVYRTVGRVMPCDDFVIDGYDPETNEIVPIYAIEHPNRRVSTERYVADHGLAGRVVHSHESILLNSLEEIDASGIEYELFGSAAPDPTQSILAVPMLRQGKMVGMISAQSHKPNAYTRDDQYLLELLASHTAIAIENSRLFAAFERLANTDPLTGALTRRKFFETAEREFHRVKRYKLPLSVIMLDVDEFKKFNDQFGHRVGDQVLKMVAAQCMTSLRKVDLFGRLGGEEFAAVLPETNLEQAGRIADRLCRLIKTMDMGEAKALMTHPRGKAGRNKALRITISAGVAAYDETCESIEMMLDRADRAMYMGKYGGRDQINIWNDGAV